MRHLPCLPIPLLKRPAALGATALLLLAVAGPATARDRQLLPWERPLTAQRTQAAAADAARVPRCETLRDWIRTPPPPGAKPGLDANFLLSDAVFVPVFGKPAIDLSDADLRALTRVTYHCDERLFEPQEAVALKKLLHPVQRDRLRHERYMTQRQQTVDTTLDPAEQETFTDAQRAEIDRLRYDGPSRARRPDPNLLVYLAGRFDDKLIEKSFQPLQRRDRGGRALGPITGFGYALCVYGRREDRFNVRQFAFWLHHRPVDDITMLRDWDKGWLRRYDIAIDQCPTTLAGAMEAIYGPDARQQAAALAADPARHGTGPAPDPNPGWLEGAQAQSAAADAALAATLDREIAALESPERGPEMLDRFTRAMAETIRPGIETLARSAHVQAQSIPKTEAGRAAFEAWDRGVGGAALSAVRRVSALLQRNADRKRTLGGDRTDFVRDRNAARWEAAREASAYLGPIAGDLYALYRAQLDARGVFAPELQRQMLAALKVEPAETQAWRRRLEVPTASRRSDDGPDLMTLDEMAAAEFGRAMGQAAGGFIAAAVQLKVARDELDHRIRSTRTAFWSCLDSRCADAPARYLAYSKALRDKDIYYLVKPAVMGQAGGGMLSFVDEMISESLGAVDGGPDRKGCSAARGAASHEIWQQLDQWPGSRAESEALVARYLLSPPYLAWQRCRDQMEFIERPRR